MFKFLILGSVLTCTISAFSATSVVTPTGRVTAAYPIPVEVDLGGTTAEFTLEISSGAGNMMVLEKIGGVKIDKILTRFQAIDNTINTKITFADGSVEMHQNTIDLVAAASIPDDVDMRRSNVGSNIVEFKRSGTEYLERNISGQLSLMIKNASSRKHYVNAVNLTVNASYGFGEIKITGSPYWYEPFISILGKFDRAEVISVISN